MPKRKEVERTFDVTVWNLTNGDIVKKLWSVSQAEVDEIAEQFDDEPFCEVQIEEL